MITEDTSWYPKSSICHPDNGWIVDSFSTIQENLINQCIWFLSLLKLEKKKYNVSWRLAQGFECYNFSKVALVKYTGLNWNEADKAGAYISGFHQKHFQYTKVTGPCCSFLSILLQECWHASYYQMLTQCIFKYLLAKAPKAQIGLYHILL